jgi:hypothetical protein
MIFIQRHPQSEVEKDMLLSRDQLEEFFPEWELYRKSGSFEIHNTPENVQFCKYLKAWNITGKCKIKPKDSTQLQVWRKHS